MTRGQSFEDGMSICKQFQLIKVIVKDELLIEPYGYNKIFLGLHLGANC